MRNKKTKDGKGSNKKLYVNDKYKSNIEMKRGRNKVKKNRKITLRNKGKGSCSRERKINKEEKRTLKKKTEKYW